MIIDILRSACECLNCNGKWLGAMGDDEIYWTFLYSIIPLSYFAKEIERERQGRPSRPTGTKAARNNNNNKTQYTMILQQG